jgi:hypothetical protein
MKEFIIGLLLGLVLNPFIDVAKDYIECLKLNAKLKILQSNAKISNIENLLNAQLEELYEAYGDNYYDDEEE